MAVIDTMSSAYSIHAEKPVQNLLSELPQNYIGQSHFGKTRQLWKLQQNPPIKFAPFLVDCWDLPADDLIGSYNSTKSPVVVISFCIYFTS